MAQKVSIIIPTLPERKKQLARLERSLQRSTFPDLEILVVDGTGGLAAARNYGTRQAQGKYLLFIDDDNVVAPNMVEKLAKALESQNTPATPRTQRHAVNPAWFYGSTGDGCRNNLIAVGPITYYLSDPDRIWFMGSRFNLITSRPYFYKEPVRGRMLDNGLMRVENLHNCFMVKKEVGEKVGWFDEKMVMGGTEFDFFQRVQKTSPHLFLAIHLKAHCYHDIPTPEKNTFRNLGFNHPKRAYFFQRNRAILIKRHGQLYQKVLFGILAYPLFLLGYSLLFLTKKRLSFLIQHLKGTLHGYFYLLTREIKPDGFNS